MDAVDLQRGGAPANGAVESSGAGSGVGPGLSPGAGEFLLWQLADSALPTGGFAHSGGLEAAWQQGEVRTRADLVSLVEAAVEQAGWNALPLVRAAHAEPARLAEWDVVAEAFTSNHVANRASRLQGRAFWAAAARIFPGTTEAGAGPEFGHWAPVFGVVTRRLGLGGETAARLFLHHFVRGLLAAAVRLNIVGPMEGQAMQWRLADRMDRVARESAGRGLDDLAQTAPVLELWQGAQDRLYSRLFQS